ncbi:MAG: hypothetical protein ACR2M0_13325 [Chloroflexia bacterium]
MNKRCFGSVTVYLLFSAVLLQGCTTGTALGAPTATPAALTVPTPLGTSPTATPSSAQPSATPEAQFTPIELTNITQAEYEQALAKWRARGVSEYEITLIDATRLDIGGKLRLRIKVENGEPRVVSYTDLNQGRSQVIPLDTLSADKRDYLPELSVERMFRLLGKLFTGEWANSYAYSAHYEVGFDPALGYPTYVHSWIVEKGYRIYDAGIGFEVLSVHILKSNVPGMPKTGNPDPIPQPHSCIRAPYSWTASPPSAEILRYAQNDSGGGGAAPRTTHYALRTNHQPLTTNHSFVVQ